MSPLRILVVEDHEGLRETTVEYLETQGHAVQGFDCAEELDECEELSHTDIVLIDVGLPGEDGFSLARRLRAAQPGLGIIMLTARNQEEDKVVGYDNGADLYLTKPFSPRTLQAAILALSRRLHPDELINASEAVLRLDPATLQLQGPLTTVDLSESECGVLAGLARANGHHLESWQLIELTGKDLDTYSKASLEVLIVRLRKKLLSAGAPEHAIKAMRGRGYRLSIPLILV